MDMKLITKFVLVIASLTAGIIIVGGSALLMVRDVQHDVEVISNDFLPSIETLDAMEIDVHKARAIALEMMVSNDDETLALLLRELDEVNASTTALMQHYKSGLITEEEDRILFEKISALRVTVNAELDVVTKLSVKHDIVAAKANWTQLDEKIDKLETTLNEARIKERKSAHEHLQNSRIAFHQSQVRALFLVVGAFGLGVVLSVLVYRKIAKPIQNLTDELLAFEKAPDLSIRFEDQSLSELEVISRSLNLLMEWVHSHAGQLEAQRDQIAHMANHDALTGLPVWRLGKDRLEVALALAKRAHEKVAVMFIDLDGFKAVNDTYGHDGGDVLLKEIAMRLKHEIRAEDTVARIGGDEFVVIMGRQADNEVASQIALRIIGSVAKGVAYQSHNMQVGTSIGIAIYPEHGQDVESLLAAADQAMYIVKRAGKNNFSFPVAQDHN